MEKIQVGKHVTLAYEIFVENDGEFVSMYKYTAQRPDHFVFGLDPGMIEGFMKNIINLEQGAEFDFSLKPAEAFGEPDPEMIVDFDRDVFKNGDGEFDSERVFEGGVVPMLTAEGYRVEGIVTHLDEDKVTIDFNHQLAGKTVRYAGRVIEVRDATPEELQPKHHHCGCGCDHDHEHCDHDHDHCDCGCEGCN